MQFCLDRGKNGRKEIWEKNYTRALTIILMCRIQNPEDWYHPCHAA